MVVNRLTDLKVSNLNKLVPFFATFCQMSVPSLNTVYKACNSSRNRNQTEGRCSVKLPPGWTVLILTGLKVITNSKPCVSKVTNTFHNKFS